MKRSLVLLAVLFLIPWAASADSFIPGVRGVYALGTKGQSVPDKVLNHPDLTGVSLRASWSECQPKEDSWNWSFDDEIKRARKAGKKVMLRVAPGENSPEWVFQSGIKTFTFEDNNPHHATFGQKRQMPIPWDPIYLKKWTAFVQALGKKYAEDDSVVLVHVTGPVKAGGEMHLPKTKIDKQNWDKAGYSKEKLVQAWKTVIDAYGEAFPKTGLAINVSIPLWNDGVVEEVLAYAKEKWGKRLHVQHNALAAKTKEGFRPQYWVRSYKDKATVGFQLLSSVTPQGKFNDEGRRFGGTLKEGFQKGLDAGASYFEIYPVDLSNEETAKDIRELAKTLK